MKYFILLILNLSCLFSEEDSTKIYWNSLSTDVTVGVPIADDESLERGRIQVKVSFDDGKTYNNLGEEFFIEEGDIDDLKEVSIAEELFESSSGFIENGTAQFIAQVWDRAGNSITGSVSDSVLNIDQVLPESISLEITSSNSINPDMAMPGDSITFQLNTTENILTPLFVINGEEYENAVGLGKSWMLVFYADDADDGEIGFKVSFKDVAGNPGKTVSQATDSKSIIMDGTEPELSDVNLFSSNKYDSTLAIEGDSVFLNFKSSEKIRDLKVVLNNIEAQVYKESDLEYVFYHVFTKSDSEGVIPIQIDYKDLAGNLGEIIEETSDDSEVNYDMTPPAEFKVERVGSLKGQIKLEELISGEISGNQKKEKKSLTLMSMIFLGLFCLSFLIFWISWFKIFSRLGQAGWKVLIPVFNIYIFTKIIEKPIWWLALYLILPVGYILSSIQVAKLFNKKSVFIVGLILLPIIFFPLLAFKKN
jgi:hypothetical protein